MSKMKWDKSLSVGVELIDIQHQEWFRHLNELAEAMAKTQGARRIAETLGFLIDYTKFHFSTEEKYMAEFGYPDREAHQAKHRELRATLADLDEDFGQEGATNKLADAVNTFLGNWLVSHIRTVDLKFGAYLKEKGFMILG